jgi:hypothetical protein
VTHCLYINYFPLWIFLIGTSGVVAPSFSGHEAPNASSSIREHLLREYPDWKLVGVGDLLPHHRELWAGEHAKECPGLVLGRFEPTGKWLAAALIVPSSANDQRAKLILIKENNRKYYFKILADIGQRGPTPVLFKSPAGKYKSWDGSLTVRTRYPVISLVSYESSATVFYWAGGKFHQLQVSD